MTRFIETITQFDKGDWGDMGRHRAGKLEDGFFKSKNMLVYSDGSIGPRPGLAKLSHTGLPTGEIMLIGSAAGEIGGYAGVVFFIVGDTFYYVPATVAGATVTVGTLAGTETSFSSSSVIQANNSMWFATATQGLYQWNYGSGALVQRRATSGLYDVELYRDRLYAAASQRTYYSEASDFATWDSLAYFDVGYQYATYRLGALRNSLHFARQGGGHYALTGVPESTSTLRRISDGLLAPDQHSAVVIHNDQMMWIPAARNAPVVNVNGVIDDRSLEHLEDWTTADAGERGAAFSYGRKSILFVGSDNTGLVSRNHIWTYHDWGVDVDIPVTRVASTRFVLSDGGASGSAPNFYLWSPSGDKPGFVSTSMSPPGDNSNTPVDAWLSLPEWTHPSAKEVQVQSVEVVFTSWNTGTTETAHFDVVVEATRQVGIGTSPADGTTSAAQSFDEAVASSSTSGTERRMRFNFGDQGFGRGYQIRFTNIRSVSIRSVSAVIDDEPRNSV